jgi:CheY-like chemotaxis protein
MDIEQMIFGFIIAFFCGVVLFVVIVLLKDRKSLAARRKTTTFRMPKVADAGQPAEGGGDQPTSGGSRQVSDARPAGGDGNPAAADGQSAGDDDPSGYDQPAEDENYPGEDYSDEQGRPAADENGDYPPEGDQPAEGEDYSDEQGRPAADDQSVTEDDNPPPNDLPKDGGDYPQKDHLGKDRSGEKELAGSGARPLAALLPDGEGPADDTRETQAVSMADMMAAYLEEEKAVAAEASKSAPSVAEASKLAPVAEERPKLASAIAEAHKPEPVVAEAPKLAPAAEDRPKLPPQKRRVPETVRFKERKILLAEDIEANRELISMFLDGIGIKLDFAENGKQALEKFEENPLAYCLILMDIRMPVMDGYEAARNIRALDEDWAKQIPIIAMTADVLKEDIDQCFDAGMDDYLSKPVDIDTLKEKVFEHISLSEE